MVCCVIDWVVRLVGGDWVGVVFFFNYLLCVGILFILFRCFFIDLFICVRKGFNVGRIGLCSCWGVWFRWYDRCWCGVIRVDVDCLVFYGFIG